ncbi:DUF2238 domain-containing protein [Vibrio astriarenae]
MQSKFPTTLKGLTLLYSFVFIFSAWEPASRAVWIAEIIPVVAVLAIVWLISKNTPLSKTAYVFLFIWMFMHTIGSKYTFAEVPFDWFNNLIGSERNHFDRVAHFSIGFFAYPIAELLIRKRVCAPFWAGLFGLLAMISVAGLYEIIEWWYAELAGGDEGIAFLGSQGDIWDAQKDMLMDTLGALFSLGVMAIQRPEFVRQARLNRG